jgi:oligoribonuclease NrnB/cAMP/cGMP phosphodiesterase (DHH superfamily)
MSVILPKPDVILTHESDLDGLVAGVLLKRLASTLFGLDVRLEAYNYHAWKSRDLRERSAWVTDLSFEQRLDKQNWLVVDHHPTDLTPRQATLVYDTEKSAGLLCYDLCRENGMSSPELDRLVHLNNVSDLFLDEDPDFVLAGDYANLVKSYGFWNLLTLVEGQIERLLDHPLLAVMAVKRQVEDPIGLAWSKANITQISSQVGFVDTVVGNNNLIVHQLLEHQATRYPVLLTLFRRSNGVMIASLRSKNGEARRVAEKLQGGGHPNASGATLPRSVKNVQDAISFLRQALNPRVDEGLNSLEAAFNGLDEL